MGRNAFAGGLAAITPSYSPISRRAVLILTAATFPLTSRALGQTVDMTAVESANVKPVGRIFELFGRADTTGEELVSPMTDDCVFRSEDGAPVAGNQAMAQVFNRFLANGKRYEVQTLKVFAKGVVLTNFRHEYAIVDGKRSEKPSARVGFLSCVRAKSKSGAVSRDNFVSANGARGVHVCAGGTRPETGRDWC